MPGAALSRVGWKEKTGQNPQRRAPFQPASKRTINAGKYGMDSMKNGFIQSHEGRRREHFKHLSRAR
jgi:hypothetical protein